MPPSNPDRLGSSPFAATYGPAGVIGADVDLLTEGGGPCRFIRCGTAGNLVAKCARGGASVTIYAVAAGETIKLQATALVASGSTVTQITVFWLPVATQAPPAGAAAGAPPLQPVEAVDWHKKRLPMSKAAADSLEGEARKTAFFIAGVAQADLISDVQTQLAKALADGTTLEDFKASVGAKLEASWQGTVENPAARLETIFRTNVQSSYNAGRYAQATDEDTLKLRPYWVFDAVLDKRTTNGCIDCNGVVHEADSDWWKANLPPRHFNCRSTFHPVTKRQAERMGVTERPPLEQAAPGFGNTPHKAAAPAPDKSAAPVASIHAETGLPEPPRALVPPGTWDKNGKRPKAPKPDLSALPPVQPHPAIPLESGTYQLPLEALKSVKADPTDLHEYATARNAHAKAEKRGEPVDGVEPIQIKMLPNGHLVAEGGDAHLVAAREFKAASVEVKLDVPNDLHPGVTQGEFPGVFHTPFKLVPPVSPTPAIEPSAPMTPSAGVQPSPGVSIKITYTDYSHPLGLTSAHITPRHSPELEAISKHIKTGDSEAIRKWLRASFEEDGMRSRAPAGGKNVFEVNLKKVGLGGACYDPNTGEISLRPDVHQFLVSFASKIESKNYSAITQSEVISFRAVIHEVGHEHSPLDPALFGAEGQPSSVLITNIDEVGNEMFARSKTRKMLGIAHTHTYGGPALLSPSLAADVTIWEAYDGLILEVKRILHERLGEQGIIRTDDDLDRMIEDAAERMRSSNVVKLSPQAFLERFASSLTRSVPSGREAFARDLVDRFTVSPVLNKVADMLP